MASVMTEAHRCYYLHQYEQALSLLCSYRPVNLDTEIDKRILEAKANYCLCRRGTSYSKLAELIKGFGCNEQTARICSLIVRLFPWHPKSIDLAEWSVRLAHEMPESHAAYITALVYNHRVELAIKHFDRFNQFLEPYEKHYCEIIINSALGEHFRTVQKSRTLFTYPFEPIDLFRIIHHFTTGLYYQFHGDADKAVESAIALIEEVRPLTLIDKARSYVAFARLYFYAGNIPKSIEYIKLAINVGLEQHPYLWWALGWLNFRCRKDIPTATAALEKFLLLLSQYEGVYDIFEEGWHELCKVHSLTALCILYIIRLRIFNSVKYMIRLFREIKNLNKYEREWKVYFQRCGFLDFERP